MIFCHTIRAFYTCRWIIINNTIKSFIWCYAKYINILKIYAIKIFVFWKYVLMTNWLNWQIPVYKYYISRFLLQEVIENVSEKSYYITYYSLLSQMKGICVWSHPIFMTMMYTKLELDMNNLDSSEVNVSHFDTEQLNSPAILK